MSEGIGGSERGGRARQRRRRGRNYIPGGTGREVRRIGSRFRRRKGSSGKEREKEKRERVRELKRTGERERGNERDGAARVVGTGESAGDERQKAGENDVH